MIIMYVLTVNRLHKKVKDFENLYNKQKTRKKFSLQKLINYFNQQSVIFSCHKSAKKQKKKDFVKKKKELKTVSSPNIALVESADTIQLLDSKNGSQKLLPSPKMNQSCSCQAIGDKKINSLKNYSFSTLKLANAKVINTSFVSLNTEIKQPSLTLTTHKAPIKQTSQMNLRYVVNKHRLINRAVTVFQNNRESIAVKNEQKAVKVLGIVFVVFVIAWVPFAIVNMLSAICSSCNQYPQILDFLVWLGYISSCINPLIYNAFNEKFRRAFKTIITCKIRNFKKYSFQRRNEIILRQNLAETASISNASNRQQFSKSLKRSYNSPSIEFEKKKEKSTIKNCKKNVVIRFKMPQIDLKQ